MTAESMADVFSSTVMAKLMYCAAAWSGFASAADRTRLDAFLRRCQRLGYCSGETPTTVSELFSDTDDALFSRVLANKDHVLQPYLPDRQSTQYNLRAKTHNKELIVKTQHLTDSDYIVRMLYKNIDVFI